MNSNYRKNLKDLATACKNYVDETKEQILWQVGQYNITTQDDNTIAYQKVVPTGATRGKLKSIGFMSYKSENLLNISDVAETTTNGITYKCENGVLSISGTATADANIGLNLGLDVLGTYYLKVFNWVNGLGIDYWCLNNEYAYDFYTTSGGGITATKTYSSANLLRSIRFKVANGTAISGTLQLKPMLVKGSTAPSEWKQGFTGIRDSVITSIKSYGANVFDFNENVVSVTTGTSPLSIALTIDDVNDIINAKTTDTYSRAIVKLSENLIPGTTYTFSFNIVTNASVGRIALSSTGNHIDDRDYGYLSAVTSGVKTLTFTAVNNKLFLHLYLCTSVNNNCDMTISDIMLNYGSTALPYKAYRGLIDAFTIPNEVQALEGYGRGINENCYNELNLESKAFTDKDIKFNLPNTYFSLDGSGDNRMFRTSLNNELYTAIGQRSFGDRSGANPNAMCNYYPLGYYAIEGTWYFASDNYLRIKDSSLATKTDFNNKYPNGLDFMFELATYNITNNLELPNNVIEVEEGGYLVFENPYGQAVPSNITYRIEVAK